MAKAKAPTVRSVSATLAAAGHTACKKSGSVPTSDGFWVSRCAPDQQIVVRHVGNNEAALRRYEKTLSKKFTLLREPRWITIKGLVATKVCPKCHAEHQPPFNQRSAGRSQHCPACAAEADRRLEALFKT